MLTIWPAGIWYFVRCCISGDWYCYLSNDIYRSFRYGWARNNHSQTILMSVSIQSVPHEQRLHTRTRFSLMSDWAYRPLHIAVYSNIYSVPCSKVPHTSCVLLSITCSQGNKGSDSLCPKTDASALYNRIEDQLDILTIQSAYSTTWHCWHDWLVSSFVSHYYLSWVLAKCSNEMKHACHPERQMRQGSAHLLSPSLWSTQTKSLWLSLSFAEPLYRRVDAKLADSLKLVIRSTNLARGLLWW